MAKSFNPKWEEVQAMYPGFGSPEWVKANLEGHFDEMFTEAELGSEQLQDDKAEVIGQQIDLVYLETGEDI